jgi:hypothetical protein
VTQDKLVENFIGGAEFDQKFRSQYPSATDADFVRYLYVNILGRTPSAAELNGHLPLAAVNGRRDKARDFLNSTEFRNRIDARLTALLLYATLLSRDGSKADLDFKEGQLKGTPPVPVQTLVDAFVKSSEFNGLIE